MTRAPIDAAAQVRAGEALPLDALAPWLSAHVPSLTGPLTLSQFPRGHSNLTYLLKAGDSEVVLRRPPFGAAIKSAHDMGREYRILSALAGHYEVIPRAIAHCDDPEVLGAPFYLMERVRGRIIRKTVPPDLAGSADLIAKLSLAFTDNLAAIHRVDWRAAGLADLYRGQGYVARQVQGWSRRYERAQTDVIPEMAAVGAWLSGHLPEDSAPTLIHNDYKHDNLVLDPTDPTRILAVLDWEMATIGDPLMDLGTTLGYWIEAGDPAHLQQFAFCPSNVPGAPTRQGLVDAYQAASGREVAQPVFYFVYGLFKLAVVAQQIYQRFKLGHTADPRFARFIFGVKILGELACRTIDADRL